LYSTVVGIFKAENIVNLKSGLGLAQSRWKLHHSIDRARVSVRIR